MADEETPPKGKKKIKTSQRGIVQFILLKKNSTIIL